MSIKTREIIIDTLGEIFSITPGDNDRIRTLGYSGVGDGAGMEYYYDATSTATIDGGVVLPGEGGSLSFDASGVFDGTAGRGRFVALLPNRVITPEMFGADATGTNVCTAEFQRFLDFIETNEQYIYRALGRYKIDDTLYLRNARWFNLQIGQSGAGKNRGVKMTGIEYVGAGGSSFTPSECKPTLVLYRCSDFNMPVLNIWQVKDGTEQANTTGLLVHGGDSGQRGYCTVGEIVVVGFGYGVVMGLSDAAAGTYRDAGTYNDDIFENWNVQDIRISGCRKAMYVDSKTADGSRIDNLWMGNYRPEIVDPDFGPTDEILHVENCGNWSVGYLQLVQAVMGVSRVRVTVSGVDDVGDTLDYSGHGLVNGETVQLKLAANSGSMPGGLSESTLYRVVNANANDFQLSLDVSGTPIDITSQPSDDLLVIKLDGSEAAMKVNSAGTLTVEKGNCEQEFCKLFKSTTGSDSRNGVTMSNMSCIENSRDINDVCIDCASAIRLNDCQLAGWVDVDLDAFSGRGNWFYDPGYGFRDRTSGYTRPNYIGTLKRADTSTPLTESDNISSFISTPIIYRPGFLEFYSPFTHKFDGEFTYITGSASNNLAVLDTSGLINTGTYRDPVLFELRSSGEALPGGLEEFTRYEVRNIINPTTLNFYDPQDATNLLTLNASGVSGSPVMHNAVDIWKYKLSTTSHRIYCEADLVFCSQNSAGNAYIKRMKCSATIAMNANLDWTINTSGEVLDEINAGITDPIAMAGFGIDLDASSEPVLYLSAAANSNLDMYCGANITVKGIRANALIAHHYNQVVSDSVKHAWMHTKEITVDANDLSNGYVTLDVNAQDVHDIVTFTDRDQDFSYSYSNQRLTLGSTFLATLSPSDVIKVRYERP